MTSIFKYAASVAALFALSACVTPVKPADEAAPIRVVPSAGATPTPEIVPSVLSAPAEVKAPEATTTPDFTQQTLYYNAMTQWELQSFVEAVRGAGLESALDGETVYTVFAPNSDAFTLAGGDASADLLKAHVVAGAYSQADLKDAIASKGSLSLTSLAGTELKFYNFSDTLKIAGPGGVLVNFAGSSRESSNGALHQITAVITP